MKINPMPKFCKFESENRKKWLITYCTLVSNTRTTLPMYRLVKGCFPSFQFTRYGAEAKLKDHYYLDGKRKKPLTD